MNSMILNGVADARHMIQLLPPIDFEAGLVVRQDIPAETGAHAGERVGETGETGAVVEWAVVADGSIRVRRP